MKHGKMISRLGMLFFIICLCALALPFFTKKTVIAENVDAEDDVIRDGFSYYIDTDTSCLTITGNGAMTAITIADGTGNNKFEVTRPWAGTEEEAAQITSVTVGEGITAIPAGTFSNLPNLVSIHLPATVTSIGDYAFYGCTSLESITLPDNVTSIGAEAFAGCKSLTSIHFGEKMESFGTLALWNTASLAEITIDPANSYFTIANNALCSLDKTTIYAYPASLTKSITLPAAAQTIESGAFAFSKAPSATIPKKIKSIAGGAFYSCKSLKKVIFDKQSACTSLDCFVKKYHSDLTVRYGAFENCSKLKEFCAPNKMKQIAARSFVNCSRVKSVSLGKNFQYFTNGNKTQTSFSKTGMKKLASISVSEKNTRFSSKNGCLYNKKKTKLYMRPVKS
ncbi:MAG: leucine-rich repeat domain-containing protein [Clostridiaceae bacterium]|nr:leucine-rich repeat domain-containing protein [Clostridiaceae bacterium]